VGTVAVVGGTGFLGRHAVPALLAAGFEARVLSRRTGCDARAIGPEALRGCDAAVNLAGIKREEGAQTFRSVHVELVERLAGAMREAGVRRLVHVSAVVAREAPDLPYHDSKWRGEEAVRASGLDWTILRPGVIYGLGDDLLNHLVLMIRASPVFPVVGKGLAPMMPVDAKDVARAAAAALGRPESAGKTYELVGPERLALRDVVRRVAEAAGLRVRIWGTPVGLMRLPVALMERTMRQPLSTSAQLAMLQEGLAGDPEPARRELGVETAPFTPERLRPLVARVERRAPFDLRLFSAPRPEREVGGPAALALALLGALLLSWAMGRHDPWTGMGVATGVPLGAAALLPPVARRLAPSLFRLGAGLLAAAVLYGGTRLVLAALPSVWPGWSGQARLLFAWQEGHGAPFLLGTLPLIVLGEEVLWRGVVARFMIERAGRAWGIVLAAAVYTAAHLASFNPLLLAAAFLCGLFWGWLYAATDSLVPPLVCHVAWDAALLFVTPLVSLPG
jgi:NADH dehydrogenase